MKRLETPKDDEAAKQSKQDGQKLAAQASRTVDVSIADPVNRTAVQTSVDAPEKPATIPTAGGSSRAHTAESARSPTSSRKSVHRNHASRRESRNRPKQQTTARPTFVL